MVFYKEWISLEKRYFRLLIMISEMGGTFTGNLSDIHRTISRDPSIVKVQSKTRKAIKKAIDYLEHNKFINCTKFGRMYSLSIIPFEKQEELSNDNYEKLRNYNFRGEVSWEETLRVYLWLYVDCISGEEKEYITQSMIESDLRISKSTIGCAEKYLEKGLGAITIQPIRKVVGTDENGNDIYHRRGHKVTITAYWN